MMKQKESVTSSQEDSVLHLPALYQRLFSLPAAMIARMNNA